MPLHPAPRNFLMHSYTPHQLPAHSCAQPPLQWGWQGFRSTADTACTTGFRPLLSAPREPLRQLTHRTPPINDFGCFAVATRQHQAESRRNCFQPRLEIWDSGPPLAAGPFGKPILLRTAFARSVRAMISSQPLGYNPPTCRCVTGVSFSI